MKKQKNKKTPLKLKVKDGIVAIEYSTMQKDEKPRNNNIFLLVCVGVFVGFVNGFWGGGGGMICVPILTNLLKLPEKNGHATTILIMLPLCIASFVVYLINGTIKWSIAINVGVGFVAGGIIGALMLKKINNVVLKLIFAIVIIAGGVKLIL